MFTCLKKGNLSRLSGLLFHLFNRYKFIACKHFEMHEFVKTWQPLLSLFWYYYSFIVMLFILIKIYLIRYFIYMLASVLLFFSFLLTLLFPLFFFFAFVLGFFFIFFFGLVSSLFHYSWMSVSKCERKEILNCIYFICFLETEKNPIQTEWWSHTTVRIKT